MLKLAVAVWYTLTVLFAPVLCCCGFRPSAACHPVTAAAEAAKPAEPASCSHCCAEPSPPTCPEDRPTPLSSSPGPAPCPCKHVQASLRDTLPLTDRPVADGLDGHKWPAAPFALSPALGPATPDRSAADPAGNTPYPTTDQLLHVFHRLRC